MKAYGIAVKSAGARFEPFSFERREPGPTDVVIEIAYCGVCHSDLHQARNEWGGAIFPMVPGHEIIGRVLVVGAQVEGFRKGDLAGVGCMVNSCRICDNCKAGEEQFCRQGPTFTYNTPDKDGSITLGGYSNLIVVDEAFVLKISPTVDLAATAPLLCAGITTYSPLKHWQVGPGKKVGIVGLGGLGHMALKFAHAFGAHVVQFTTAESKKADALRLGAHQVIMSNTAEEMAAQENSFDFILDTVSASHDLNVYLNLLKRNGTMTIVGVPDKPPTIFSPSLIFRRASLAGSLIGGLRETQEMLDFCAEHKITADIEQIGVGDIDTAFDRMVKSDVKYRFVIDLATAKDPKGA